ncbi:hypothetical protein HMF8227_02339 [Saliniradius amylolyticus]|uniref:Uncharacterized protein n=1 Tax=Saliniradius amylolyticus TaxID=2183582 RepID=A0A2S2E558_9ALTE|nr:phage regulatory CII family protein [Saliniradius amylolyticus]AWL12791.1 hypothetical protein HMF8227_02339 [Saliniradius amylolyticus]
MMDRSRVAPVERAAYDFVRRKGARYFETLLGKKPNVLSNEVNPNTPTHKLGLLDSLLMQLDTSDFSILHTCNHVCGFQAVALGRNFHDTSDMELLNRYSNWHAEIGDVNRELNSALADGDISAKEYERIEREFFEAIAAGFEFLARARHLVPELTPEVPHG